MNAKTTIKSDYGTIDAEVLAELRRSFATSDLIAAIGALDENEGRQQWLRRCLRRLHAMAGHLIDGTTPQIVRGSEPIWQLAEEIADELDAHTASLSHITKVVDRLGRLRPNDVDYRIK